MLLPGARGLRNPGRGCNSGEVILLTEDAQVNCTPVPEFRELER